MTSETSTISADQSLEELRRELAEAREQEAATAEILRVISSSPTDLQHMCAVVTSSAARLCDAFDATIFQVDGHLLRRVAHHGSILQDDILPLTRGVVTGRAVLDRRTIQVADVQAETGEYPEGSDRAQRIGHRTILAVPLMRASEAIGVIAIRRSEVRAFTDRQVDLVKIFADQAVIAIENTRLLNEVRDSLQQQTATADVLKAISHSTFNLPKVLDTLVESAARLCDAFDALILQADGDVLHPVGHYGSIPIPGPLPVVDGTVMARAVIERRTIQVADLQTAVEEYPVGSDFAIRACFRTQLVVPLSRGGEAIGVIAIRRSEVRPFTEHQTELLQTFADQAVIAIENTRLFEAEQARTNELQESLEYQTATSDVLEVISTSPNDVKPVLEAIASTSGRLCQADDAHIFLLSDGKHRLAAANNPDNEWVRVLNDNPLTVDTPGSVTARAIREKRVVHIEDTRADPKHAEGLLSRQPRRTVISDPLLREGRVVGAITLNRRTVSAFTPRQVSLLETFADQAVIAIENARLFEEVQARTREVQEALEQQTATSEVLSVISSSPGELDAVFRAMLANAVRICEANFGTLHRYDGNRFCPAA